MPPQPIEPWSDIKPATKFGSGCLNSLVLIPDWIPGVDFEDLQGDEDCLFINVNTPITDFDEVPHPSMPVIVSKFSLKYPIVNLEGIFKHLGLYSRWIFHVW